MNTIDLVFTGGDLEVKYDIDGNAIDPLPEMVKKRCFTLPENATASFLSKPNITSDSLDYIGKLKEDIHKFSHVPDVSDDKIFGTSGVALKYKMQPLEYLCALKENNFRKGLTRRLELLCNFLSLKNREFDFSEITISFTRNMVEDIASVYDTVLKLKDVISTETLLEKLPDINKEIELERIKQEKEENMEEFQNQLPIQNEEEVMEIPEIKGKEQ